MARYIVGIDLGTTHTVVAYADTGRGSGAQTLRLFPIEQLVAAGEVVARPMLPSARYHPASGEFRPSDLLLPWTEGRDGRGAETPAIIGAFARELGSRTPGRLVTSAKSWLSHPSVDRTAPILPWGASAAVPKVSPLEASASYLGHVRAAWNHAFPDHRLERQEVVLTVPASFDEGARALTVQAAKLAGLRELRLVEEPQAACYDWLSRHEAGLQDALGGCQLLLVCDVGGGTTDLTLIGIEYGRGGPTFNRIGVGDHLMLGGDNMDLALAHVAERRLLAGGGRLGAGDLAMFVEQCRLAKERLLGVAAPASASVTVLGTGTKLIAAARTTQLTAEQVQRLVLDGFLPLCAAAERPRGVRGGLVELGLTYATDPAITRHVARFLDRHQQVCREALGPRARDAGPAMPEAVLLNGGVFRSEAIADRLVHNLADWRGMPVHRLRNEAPELAVARGAVAYGLARRGIGRRIGGGSARSYFLVVASERGESEHGVCLLPRGTEEDHELRLAHRRFALRLGQPVRFHVVSSTADRRYRAGDVVQVTGEDFKELPPIATTLETDGQPRGRGGEVEVELASVLTEVGTLAIDCVANDPRGRRWQLEFQLRGAPALRSHVGKPHPRLSEAVARVTRSYGKPVRGVSPKEVKVLRVDLERILGRREQWDTPLLRDVFAALWDGARRRRRSADHERQWFHLVGFCLRPGFGYPLDDWRVEQLWTLYGEGLQFTKEPRVWSEWWTMWRRISPGLGPCAQEQLLDDVAAYLQPPAAVRHAVVVPKGRGYDDIVRLSGSLERVPGGRKVELGSTLLARLQARGESPQAWWAVGRIGARVPFYGSAHNVVPAEVAAAWIERIMPLDWQALREIAFAATLLARMSGDRARDVDHALRARVASRLRAAKAPAGWIRMVEEVARLEEADVRLALGDSLPLGLRLVPEG